MKKKLQIFITITFLMSFEVTFAQGGGYMIDLGSSGTRYINCGTPASLDISPAITVEAWIYPTAFDEANEVFAKVGGNGTGVNTGNNFSYNIEIASGKVYYRISHDGISFAALGGSTLSANQWYHLVLSFDGTDIKGYLNGKSDGTLNSPGVIYKSTNNPVYIGYYGYWPYPFHGKIDEVRVWNTALSEATIRDWMHKEVTSSHPNNSGGNLNLKGYWKLNETSGTTVADASGNNATGSLVNTGTWTVSTAPIGSEGAFVITTTPTTIGPTGGQLNTTITSTPDNSNNLGVYQFGSVSGTPITGETYFTGVDKRSNIVWGIVERGSVTANLVFDYSNVGGIGTSSTIKLIKRTDASSTTWTEVTVSSRDDVAKTMTVVGVTDYSEFAIGAGSDNALPVELTSFIGTVNGNEIILNWQTATEVNNYGFEVERIQDNKITRLQNSNWNKVGFVQGSGNSNTQKEYSFTDKTVSNGKYVYRLKQIDNDGKHQYSKEIKIEVSAPLNFYLEQNYPNPFNPSTVISYQLPVNSFVTLKVYDVLGKEVAVLVNEEKESGTYSIDFSSANLASGTYFYRLQTGAIVQTKKFVLMK